MNADETFEKLSEEMLHKYLEKNPDYATFLGLHDPYDQLLPDGSSERLFWDLKLEEDWLKRLNETMKKQDLNEEHRIDWEVIEKAHEREKFDLYEQRRHELDPDALGLIGSLAFTMFTRNYAPLEKRVDAIAARLEKTPKYLEEFRSRFANSRPVKLWTEIAIERAQNMGGLFQFVLAVTKGKVSDKTHARLTKAVENLQPALQKYLKWLQDLLPKATSEWALGRERFEKLVKIRDLGMNSEQILKLGVNYLEELKQKREQLAKQISPGKSVKEVLKSIEDNSPKTFEDALAFTKKTMEEARRFIQDKKLVTVHPEDVLMVEETPVFMAPVLPFAAMMMPAKFDKPQIGVYVVTRPKNIADLGSYLNYKSIRNTAVHEAFPGHYLQGALSNRGSFIRLLADGPETVEGWAHYCEEMMAEKGFNADPEIRLVQVNDIIWRAVRIIVDVKLSRGEMSFDEAVDMLVKETGMTKDGATAEVKRYTQTPSYPMSYLLGKHLILQLKEELKSKMGSAFDERAFHDTIAANGYLPIAILRKVFEQKTGKAKPS